MWRSQAHLKSCYTVLFRRQWQEKWSLHEFSADTSLLFRKSVIFSFMTVWAHGCRSPRTPALAIIPLCHHTGQCLGCWGVFHSPYCPLQLPVTCDYWALSRSPLALFLVSRWVFIDRICIYLLRQLCLHSHSLLFSSSLRPFYNLFHFLWIHQSMQ